MGPTFAFVVFELEVVLSIHPLVQNGRDPADARLVEELLLPEERGVLFGVGVERVAHLVLLEAEVPLGGGLGHPLVSGVDPQGRVRSDDSVGREEHVEWLCEAGWRANENIQLVVLRMRFPDVTQLVPWRCCDFFEDLFVDHGPQLSPNGVLDLRPGSELQIGLDRRIVENPGVVLHWRSDEQVYLCTA